MFDIELMVQAELKAMQAKLANYAGATDNKELMLKLQKANEALKESVDVLGQIRAVKQLKK